MLPRATGPDGSSRCQFARLYVEYTKTGGMPSAADTAHQGRASTAGSVAGGAGPSHHRYPWLQALAVGWTGAFRSVGAGGREQ